MMTVRSAARPFGLLVAGALLLLAVPAGAQVAPEPTGGGESAQPPATEEAPIDPRAEEAFYVGNGLLAAGNPAGALAAYDQALAIDPRFHRVHLYRARAFLLLNDHGRAREATDLFASHAHSEEDKKALAEAHRRITELEHQAGSREQTSTVEADTNRRHDDRVEEEDAMPRSEKRPLTSTSKAALPPPPKALGPVFLVAGGVTAAIGLGSVVRALALSQDPATHGDGELVWSVGVPLTIVGMSLLGVGIPVSIAAQVQPVALVLAVEPVSRMGSVSLCGRW